MFRKIKAFLPKKYYQGIGKNAESQLGECFLNSTQMSITVGVFLLIKMATRVPFLLTLSDCFEAFYEA